MRIIAGQFRGRKIHPPRGFDTTRPITDRVKQSLFDRLTAMQMLGGHVLDIFSGTGSLGLESLSRGADHCTFVEQNRSARTLLEQNLAALELAANATVLAADALATNWLDRLRAAPGPARIAFCDPPYRLMTDARGAARVARLMEALVPRIEADGLLVLRTDHQTAAPRVEGWQVLQTDVHGSMALHFYQTSSE